MPPSHNDLYRMSLGDHIEELRTCLIRALIGLVLALVVTFTFGFQIIAWLAQPMLESLQVYGYTPQLYTTDSTLGFAGVYLPVTLIAAMILASPWILYQLWRFISTGLYAQEKRVVYLLAPFSTVMMALGVLFTYYVLLPVCLMFFIRWSTYYPAVDNIEPNWVLRNLLGGDTSDESAPPAEVTYADGPLELPVLAADPAELRSGMAWVDGSHNQLKVVVDGRVRSLQLMPEHLLAPLPDLGGFVKFAAMMGLGVVVAFQLPVAMLVVGWTGLFDPAYIARFRRYAMFISFLLGALLTPVDAFSMFVLAVPLYGLFEFGLFLMRWTYREPQFPEET